MHGRRSLIALAAVAGCRFAPQAAPADGATDGDGSRADASGDAVTGPWLTGYAYRKPITVTPPALTGMLADFPIAIRLVDDMELRDHAAGDDLTVTLDDATTPLDVEVVAFDKSRGDLELWTRIPTLPLDAPTTLYLYYGGPPATRMPTAVWSTAFRAVWHLGDATRDSTENALDLSLLTNDTMPASVRGIVGGANAASRASDRLTRPDDNQLDFANASFSVSLWVDEVAANGDFDMALYKGGTNDCCPGYTIMLGTNSWDAKIHDGGGNNAPGTDWRSVSFGDRAALIAANPGWIHLVMVVDRVADTLQTYADGVPVGSAAIDAIGSIASTQNFHLFRNQGTNALSGALDEVRVYTLALAPAWIAVEHANLASPSFITIGASQQLEH